MESPTPPPAASPGRVRRLVLRAGGRPGEDALADGSPAVGVNGAASLALTTGVWLVYRYCPDAAAARDWKAVQIA